MTPEEREAIEENWSCLAGPPPMKGELWFVAAFAIFGLIVWLCS